MDVFLSNNKQKKAKRNYSGFDISRYLITMLNKLVCSLFRGMEKSGSGRKIWVVGTEAV